jgi:hypothetical protein
MTAVTTPRSLIGKAIRWTFDSGPTQGRTFEHVADVKGGITYSMQGADEKPGKPTREKHAGVEKAGDGVFAFPTWAVPAIPPPSCSTSPT